MFGQANPMTGKYPFHITETAAFKGVVVNTRRVTIAPSVSDVTVSDVNDEIPIDNDAEAENLLE